MKKVAVITGGSGVLGSEITNHFLSLDYDICIIDKTGKTEMSHPNLQVYISDVTDRETLKSTADIIFEKFGKIDILINAAGGNQPKATIAEDQTIFDLDMSAFDQVVNLNLNGTVIPCLVFGELMSKSGGGAIVNYSSMSVERALTRVVGYSASKAAMENFTRWLAVEMAKKFDSKIRVNAISPGFFLGKQNKNLLINKDGSFTERAKTILNMTPMGRFGKPSDLNGLITFLCSEESSFITGAVFPVDGGFSAFSGV